MILPQPCTVPTFFLATNSIGDRQCRSLTRSLLESIAPGKALTEKSVGNSEAEGEPCGVMYTEDKAVGAVIYPTADRLKDIQVGIQL